MNKDTHKILEEIIQNNPNTKHTFFQFSPVINIHLDKLDAEDSHILLSLSEQILDVMKDLNKKQENDK